MLTVSTPAADRALMTLAEMKKALGVDDASQDAQIAAFGLMISDFIARECGLPLASAASGAVAVPTLREEIFTETIRLASCAGHIFLGRRFVKSVSSVTIDGVALPSAEYELHHASGILRRLTEADSSRAWSPGKIVIVYTAGFDTVPDSLNLLAQLVLREQWTMAVARDPLLRAEDLPGLGRREYFSGPVAATGGAAPSALSPAAAAMIGHWRYTCFDAL